jgi:hypothetical protein
MALAHVQDRALDRFAGAVRRTLGTTRPIRHVRRLAAAATLEPLVRRLATDPELAGRAGHGPLEVLDAGDHRQPPLVHG